jgi:hypothetical protein
LPGEFGGWFDTAPDPDASSRNLGTTAYISANQMLYRVPQPASGTRDSYYRQQTAAPSLTDKGLGMFIYIGLAPRNSSVINFYVSGLTKGLIPT